MYTSGETDFGRRLTTRGHKDIILVGNYLIQNKYIPQSIYYSTATRTTETAEGFQAFFLDATRQNIELCPIPELYAANPSQVVDLIYTLPDDCQSAMIIGHNPSIASLLYHCGVAEHVVTTGTGILRVHSNTWAQWAADRVELEDFIIPRQFK